MMRLIGQSGRSYDLHHRDAAARRGMSTVLRDVALGCDICVWDDRVPPAEEALAIKLAVEHREAWLLKQPLY